MLTPISVSVLIYLFTFAQPFFAVELLMSADSYMYIKGIISTITIMVVNPPSYCAKISFHQSIYTKNSVHQSNFYLSCLIRSWIAEMNYLLK